MIAVIKDINLPVLIAAIGTATIAIIRALRQETRPRDGNGQTNGKRLGEVVQAIETKLDSHLAAVGPDSELADMVAWAKKKMKDEGVEE